jgi:cytoskeletal protein RodZ
MQKKKNRWIDVKVLLAVLATTTSLLLWNVFARNSVNTGTDPASRTQNTSASSSTAVPRTRLLLGSSAPQSSSLNSPTFRAPAPVTRTGSSRP